jgi:hypothetical protein
MFEDELKELYIDAKKVAVEEFGKVAVGDVQKEFMDQLKDKIKRRFKAIREENERITEVSILVLCTLTMKPTCCVLNEHHMISLTCII